MKRRDTFRLIPLAIGGAAALSSSSQARPPLRPRPGGGGDRPSPGDGGRPGPTGALTYIRRVTTMLEQVRATQSDIILEAAHAIARTIQNGGKVYSSWDLGHTAQSDLFPGRNGAPQFVDAYYDFKDFHDGDLVLADFPWPDGYIGELSKRDLFVIGGPCPWGGDVPGAENITPAIRANRIRPSADLWIDMPVDHIGAQVPIPGSPAPLGPESGPLSGTVFWMMMADACRILARSGKSFIVNGDGPAPGPKTAWENLDRPLLGNYFDTVMRQMSMVEGELGAIRTMASMAADTVLSGGSVYFYSRYHEALAGETTGRRGGLCLAKAASDGHPAGKTGDCVIMGTYAPDDEADLRNLDEFKKRGMKIASIGPVTRDMKFSGGRAVAKETLAHAGRMTDTNGLFALPGFSRKVCPTSGILVTAITWVMSTELTLEIIRRTGNTPGINFNGALTWGAGHNGRVRAIADERGY